MPSKFDLGSAARLYLISDAHIDNPLCDLSLLQEHLRRAKDEGARVIFGGDLIDAMQSRHDPRRSMAGLKDALKRDDYADALVEETVKLLKPFAEAILALCEGNHETAIHKYTQSYVLLRVAKELGVARLPYRDMLHIKARGRTFKLWYAHGAGAHHAPVSRGVLDVARQAAWIDADVVWNGHTHTAYIVPYVRFDGSRARLTWAVRTPSYLRWKTGSDWSDERAMPPQPRGCAVVEFKSNGRVGVEMLLEA